MKTKLRIGRLLLVVIAALMAVFPFATVLATADPDDIDINAVWVYRNCKETGDQLYITDYTIDYSVLPDENVTDAYLARLMNGATELGAVAPYTYYNSGYDRGIVAIYFTAASAPAWAGSYDMKLVGNPGLTWDDGTPPDVSVSSFDLWSDYSLSVTQSNLASRVLWLAQQLESAWSVDLVEPVAGGYALTTYGESYFSSVIPDLHSMAPAAFSGQVIDPEIKIDTFTNDYGDELETNIIGTVFDFTDMANKFGVSRGTMTAIIYYGCVIALCIMLVRIIKSYKIMMMLFIPFVILGAFLGVPLVITIVIGFFALVMTAYTLFYRPSSA